MLFYGHHVNMHGKTRHAYVLCLFKYIPLTFSEIRGMLINS